jgi:hypothetical protein
MKTTQLLTLALFALCTLTTNAQNTAENTNVTSGGVQSGNYGTGNAFYGYQSGKSIGVSTYNYNTFVGNLSGVTGAGSNNVFIGYNAGFKPQEGNAQRFTPGSGNVFIGTNVGLIGTSASDFSNKLAIDNSTTNTPLIWGDFATDQLKFNGKVGIGYGFGNIPTLASGIDISSYNLFVRGGILTEEVRIMLSTQWADYVFEKDYNLFKLEEVEKFINENKHLPNVPSAAEVAENGIELGEMTKIQQEKIEELTLYLIEQNKINKQQQEEINQLKEQVKLLLEAKN